MNCPQSGQLARLFAECVAAIEKSGLLSDNAVIESFELLVTPKMKEEARRRIERAGLKR